MVDGSSPALLVDLGSLVLSTALLVTVKPDVSEVNGAAASTASAGDDRGVGESISWSDTDGGCKPSVRRSGGVYMFVVRDGSAL